MLLTVCTHHCTTTQGLAALAKALGRNRRLQYLGVAECGISDAGVHDLIGMLTQVWCGGAPRLAGCNWLTGCPCFGRWALGTSTNECRPWEFPSVPCDLSRTAVALLDDVLRLFPHIAPPLHRLRANVITDDAGVALANEILRQAHTLAYVSLSETKVCVCAVLLVACVRRPDLRLRVSCLVPQVGDATAEAVVAAAEANPVVQAVDLSKTPVSEELQYGVPHPIFTVAVRL